MEELEGERYFQRRFLRTAFDSVNGALAGLSETCEELSQWTEDDEEIDKDTFEFLFKYLVEMNKTMQAFEAVSEKLLPLKYIQLWKKN